MRPPLQTTNYKQKTTNNKQQTTNNKQQQTTNNKQQTTNNKQQTTNNKQQTTREREREKEQQEQQKQEEEQEEQGTFSSWDGRASISDGEGCWEGTFFFFSFLGILSTPRSPKHLKKIRRKKIRRKKKTNKPFALLRVLGGWEEKESLEEQRGLLENSFIFGLSYLDSNTIQVFILNSLHKPKQPKLHAKQQNKTTSHLRWLRESHTTNNQPTSIHSNQANTTSTKSRRTLIQ